MVPFDGSRLSEAALLKARIHAIALNDAPADIRNEIFREEPLDVVAVSIVPENKYYAQEMGWIEDGEDFSAREVIEDLHQQVEEIAPNAGFQFERVDRSASAGTISLRLRSFAEDLDAQSVFLGSENAGRIVTPLSSVARGVSTETAYDICIVRQPLPPERRARLKSEFFIPE
jgi:nucleotide-binding universal stress UspA family protein